MPSKSSSPVTTGCGGELGSGSMSVKRHRALIHVLDRASANLRKGQIPAALTRVELGLLIAKELLARALKYQARDAEKKK